MTAHDAIDAHAPDVEPGVVLVANLVSIPGAVDAAHPALGLAGTVEVMEASPSALRLKYALSDKLAGGQAGRLHIHMGRSCREAWALHVVEGGQQDPWTAGAGASTAERTSGEFVVQHEHGEYRLREVVGPWRRLNEKPLFVSRRNERTTDE